MSHFMPQLVDDDATNRFVDEDCGKSCREIFFKSCKYFGNPLALILLRYWPILLPLSNIFMNIIPKWLS